MSSAAKPMIVGESNPYGPDSYYALFPAPENSAGGRLCRKVLGMRPRDYMQAFDRRNLLHCVTRWNAASARAAAEAILKEREESETGQPIVVLGARVAAAFGMKDLPDFAYSAGFLRLPHPSGRCRAWNDPAAFEKARQALRGFLPPEIAAMIGTAP